MRTHDNREPELGSNEGSGAPVPEVHVDCTGPGPKVDALFMQAFERHLIASKPPKYLHTLADALIRSPEAVDIEVIRQLSPQDCCRLLILVYTPISEGDGSIRTIQMYAANTVFYLCPEIYTEKVVAAILPQSAASCAFALDALVLTRQISPIHLERIGDLLDARDNSSVAHELWPVRRSFLELLANALFGLEEEQFAQLLNHLERLVELGVTDNTFCTEATTCILGIIAMSKSTGRTVCTSQKLYKILDGIDECIRAEDLTGEQFKLTHPALPLFDLCGHLSEVRRTGGDPQTAHFEKQYPQIPPTTQQDLVNAICDLLDIVLRGTPEEEAFRTHIKGRSVDISEGGAVLADYWQERGDNHAAEVLRIRVDSASGLTPSKAMELAKRAVPLDLAACTPTFGVGLSWQHGKGGSYERVLNLEGPPPRWQGLRLADEFIDKIILSNGVTFDQLNGLTERSDNVLHRADLGETFQPFSQVTTIRQAESEFSNAADHMAIDGLAFDPHNTRLRHLNPDKFSGRLAKRLIINVPSGTNALFTRTGPERFFFPFDEPRSITLVGDGLPLEFGLLRSLFRRPEEIGVCNARIGRDFHEWLTDNAGGVRRLNLRGVTASPFEWLSFRDNRFDEITLIGCDRDIAKAVLRAHHECSRLKIGNDRYRNGVGRAFSNTCVGYRELRATQAEPTYIELHELGLHQHVGEVLEYRACRSATSLRIVDTTLTDEDLGSLSNTSLLRRLTHLSLGTSYVTFDGVLTFLVHAPFPTGKVVEFQLNGRYPNADGRTVGSLASVVEHLRERGMDAVMSPIDAVNETADGARMWIRY